MFAGELSLGPLPHPEPQHGAGALGRGVATTPAPLLSVPNHRSLPRRRGLRAGTLAVEKQGQVPQDGGAFHLFQAGLQGVSLCLMLVQKWNTEDGWVVVGAGGV